MRRTDPGRILALALALAPIPATAQGLEPWSDPAMGVSAQVPQGWTSDTLPGGGTLFTAPGADPRNAAHVAVHAYPDPGADLVALHDQMLHSLLLDGDQILRDSQFTQGFEIRSQTPLNKVELRRTVRLPDCEGGAKLAELRIDYPADQAAQVGPTLIAVPDSLHCP